MDPLQFIREFGLPTMALVVTGYGIWQVCAWIAKELIVPLRDRHFAFLLSIEQTLKALQETQRSIVNTQEQMVEEIERVSGLIKFPNIPKE
jgi:hypothetical protein